MRKLKLKNVKEVFQIIKIVKFETYWKKEIEISQIQKVKSAWTKGQAEPI